MIARFAVAVFFAAGLNTPAFAAPIDVYFRGTLALNESDTSASDAIAEVDAAVRSLLEGVSISGRFTLNPDAAYATPSSGTSNPNATFYDDASTGLEMIVGGNSFLDDNFDTCRSSFELICSANQVNDQIFSGLPAPFDSLFIASDVLTNLHLTQEIEGISGVSAITEFGFQQTVIGSVNFFGAGFDMFPTTDLASPLDVPQGQRAMQFILNTPSLFNTPTAQGLQRYVFDIEGLEMSDSPLPPVPLPLPGVLLICALASFGAIRRAA